MRVEVSFFPGIPDGRAERLLRSLADLPEIAGLSIADVYLLSGLTRGQAASITDLFHDSVIQSVEFFEDQRRLPESCDACVEVAYRPGVTDPVAVTIRDAVRRGAPDLDPALTEVRTATQYRLSFTPRGPGASDTPAAGGTSAAGGTRAATLDELVRRLHNPLIQDARRLSGPGDALPPAYPGVAGAPTGPGPDAPFQTFPIAGMTDDELRRLSEERLLALTLEEMQAIQGYFRRPEVREVRRTRGLPEEPTDCELEMLAQTWSEHCKHKIFQARVHYREDGSPPESHPETIDGLFNTYIRRTTEELLPARNDVLSVFHDNAGVVSFDEELALCFKVETHNSPSALDPYGGAITGIVGVNRDILGTGLGAKPIFNTNVLCFGPPDLPEVPKGLLHPRRVLEGVHHGIVDGGNQSGIPTVAGGFLFDQSFVGKPLVFCGTGGLLPRRVGRRDGFVKEIEPGDVAVMVGGRIGKDGIHGATFSSLALDETSPVSAVQIGDPITQKRMTDFLLEARDRELFRALSDNGAGGLSSSLGEMAELSGGVRVFLERCPLKYQGLEPWEIFVSESQERMSVAVRPEHFAAFVALAERHGVEATAIGEFTAAGFVEVFYADRPVALVDLEFLHDGNPQLHLEAHWPGPGVRPAASEATPQQTLPPEWQRPEALRADLLALLGDPNIGSREALIRQYDHEVQGRSVTKPFAGSGADAPTDGAVLFPRYDSTQAVAVSHGVAPWIGDYDTELMARYAVDEAVRALIALGAHPDRISALDNFCWSDPVASPENPEGAYKMAQLVRACRGLSQSCLAYGVPLISGKDSMKNDAVVEGRRISVRPTLLVSALGIVPRPVPGASIDFKAPGDRIYLLGDVPGPAGDTDAPILGCSAYERVKLPETSPFHRRRGSLGVPPRFDGPHMAAAKARYALVHRALAEGLIAGIHDLSEGGLGVALAECAIGGRLGARVTLPAGPGTSPSPAETLFCEAPGRFLVSVPPDKVDRIENLLDGSGITYLGEVIGEPELRIAFARSPGPEPEIPPVRVALADLLEAWGSTGFGRPKPGAAPGPGTAPGPGPDGRPGPGATPVPAAGPGPSGAPPREPASAPGAASRPVAVLTGYGINADAELAEAFRGVGATVVSLHLETLFADPDRLEELGILAFPGGFSYGDHLGSGRALSFLLSRRLGDRMRRFVDDGGLIIGICNGFQVLTKLGLLPGNGGGALIYNDTGVFEDSWVRIAPEAGSTSPWLEGLEPMDVPVRHGEGRFYTSAYTGRKLQESGQVAFRYQGRNPNGSFGDIAGITDPTGRVLGLMPHPEAFLRRENHPLWHSGEAPAPPLRLFANGLRAAPRFGPPIEIESWAKKP
ncbi:MAG: phosphoribosylformylglycinamidine synthase subunit PurQ [Spirochaetaceae bacterium]